MLRKSAQKKRVGRRVLSKARRKQKKLYNRKFFKIIIILVPVLGLIFLKSQTSLWTNKSKLTTVSTSENGNVRVSVLAPQEGTITNLILPAESQVNVSSQFGVWRIKSIWELGENEGVSGQLLARSVTKNFRFPVTAYFERSELLAGKKRIHSFWEILTSESDLLMGDRFRILFFATKLKNSQITNINLSDTTYLTKTTSLDGEAGYSVGSTIPVSLSSIFIDKEIYESNYKVLIKNATGGSRTAETVGEIIEVLGARFVAFEKDNADNLDCEVLGKDNRIIKKIVSVFDCQRINTDPPGAFDLEIRLGEEFVERF